MIVEDHDMSDRFFAFGDGSRRVEKELPWLGRGYGREANEPLDSHEVLGLHRLLKPLRGGLLRNACGSSTRSTGD
jgi:hypothetical protein